MSVANVQPPEDGYWAVYAIKGTPPASGGLGSTVITGAPFSATTPKPAAATMGATFPATTAKPSVVTTLKPSVATTLKPSVVTTLKPSVATTLKPSVVTTRPGTSMAQGGVFTIQNVRNKKDTSWAGGRSFVSVDTDNKDGTLVFLESSFTSTSCQWKLTPVKGKADTFTIQNIRNSSTPSYSKGYSYLNVNVRDKNDNRVFLWNNPGSPYCHWIVKPILDSNKKAVPYTFSLQNVQRITDNPRLSYLNVNLNDIPAFPRSNKNVYLWNQPSNPTCQFIIAPVA